MPVPAPAAPELPRPASRSGCLPDMSTVGPPDMLTVPPPSAGADILGGEFFGRVFLLSK